MSTRRKRRADNRAAEAAAIAQQNAQNVPGSQSTVLTTTNTNAPTGQPSTSSGPNPSPASLVSGVQGLQITTRSQASASQSGSSVSKSIKASAKDGLTKSAVDEESFEEEAFTKPVALFHQDLDDFSDKQTLFANYFAIKAGDYRILQKYTLAFQRRETEAERKDRQKNRKKDDFDTIGGNTYVDANPARPKRRRIVRLLCDRLSTHNSTTPLATDYFEQIITAKQLAKDGDGIRLNGDEWAEEINYYDEYQTPAGAHPEVFRVTVFGPEALSLDLLRGYLSKLDNSINDTTYQQKEDTVRALNIIFSYRAYERCFRRPPSPQGQPIILPTLTTKNGTKFHGIADKVFEYKDRKVPGHTETGPGSHQSEGNAAITGFARSVRTSYSPEGRIALNVNTATSVFYQKAKTLRDLIDVWRGGRTGNLQPWEIKGLNMFLMNLSVRTTYLGEHNYFGRVTALATPVSGDQPKPALCSMASPDLTQNRNLTVDGHFRTKQWAVNLLGDSNGFVVNLGEGDYLVTVPATHLDVTPGQINRNTDDKPKAGIILPRDNRDLVRGAREVLLGTDDVEIGAKQFQISLSDDLLRVPITTLKLPPILYRVRSDRTKFNTGDKEYQKTLQYGSWNLENTSFVEPAINRTWTCVELKLPYVAACLQDHVNTFITNMATTFEAQGMTGFRYIPPTTSTPPTTGKQPATGTPPATSPYRIFDLPYRFPPGRDQLDELAQQDQEIVKLLTELQEKVDFVILLVPSRQQDLYGSIKRAGDQTVGINTICHMTSDKGEPKTELGVLANISMKINLKTSRSAVNHALDSGNRGPILTARSMIIGIDVTHPGSAAMKDSPSIAAVVGSVDSDFAQWPVSLRMQMPEDAKDDPNKKGRKPRKVNDDPVKEKQVPPKIKDVQKEKPEMVKSIKDMPTKKQQRLNSIWDEPTKKQDMAKSIKDVQTKKQQPPQEIKAPQGPKKQSVEKVLELRSMVCDRLTAFCERNNATLPDQIVVYRDGLSEEQFEMCANEEYLEILGAIDVVADDPRFKVKGDKPKVLLICAVKRHHTRCFPTIDSEKDARDTGMFICKGAANKVKTVFNWNPMPGTLITERITYGHDEDFFLYSQNAIKGTARPTHYKILQNDLGSDLLDVAQMVSQDFQAPAILRETDDL